MCLHSISPKANHNNVPCRKIYSFMNKIQFVTLDNTFSSLETNNNGDVMNEVRSFNLIRVDEENGDRHGY